MPIFEIESDWRETPLTCPQCGPEYVMYSDGVQKPQCPECLYVATSAEIYYMELLNDSEVR